MPSPQYAKHAKWFDDRWMKQYQKKYAGMPMVEAHHHIVKDSIKYIMESKAFKKSEAERKIMAADVRAYVRNWGKAAQQVGADPNKMTRKQHEKINAMALEMGMKK